MAQELTAGHYIAGEIAAEGVFELHCVASGHGVPEVRGAQVDVVDREKVHTHDVPCERRAPHAKVKVWRIYAWEAFPARRQEH